MRVCVRLCACGIVCDSMIDHQQTSNHICIEVTYGRGRAIDSYKTIVVDRQ